MKYCWRITKYDPKKRNEKGWYLVDEWTAISDIGKSYEGKKFDYDEYVRVESLYINAIMQFMKCFGITSLQATGLEKRTFIYTDSHVDMQDIMFASKLQENDMLTMEEIKRASKLTLREDFWCKLVSKHRMFVRFGYDYYMYIACRSACKEAIENIRNSGLYVEDFNFSWIYD